MKYQAKIDLSNKNNSHTLAFDCIQEVSKGNKLKILEVGCSTGYLGAALTEHGHEVWGIEPYAPAAEEARCVLANVHIGFVEDFFEGNPSARFDVIVFGDVLEHLVDPLEILQKCKSFLNDGGAVVASVPNVSHVAIRAMLLEGRWDYAERGILDRTHLKFYTRDTLIDLFSDANYIVKSIETVQLSAELVDKLCGLNLKSESIAAAKQFASDNRIHDFQYVLVAKPSESEVSCELKNFSLKAELGLRVLCLLCNTELSIVDVRLRTPLKHWAQQTGSVVKIISIFEHTLEDLQWGDVFVFQRNSSEYVVELARQLQKSSKRVVFEIDDLLLDLPPFLAHHADAIEKTKPSIIELIKVADALSVSTNNLAEKLRIYSKNVCITPNYAEPTNEIAEHYDVDYTDVKLVVASSDKVLMDMIVEPLKAIQKDYRCQIIAIGPPGHFLSESGIVIQQVENMSHLDFKNFLASLDNAIGVIPLDNSSFSSCKSAVKYFDYSMAGLPTVCSNVLPYRAVITDGENGFLVDNTFDAWVGTLAPLIKSAQLRKTISREARLHVEENHNLDLSANSWSLLFDSLKVDIKSTRSGVVKNELRNLSLLRVIKKTFFYAAKPASYKTALKTLKHSGLRGVYRKLRYG